MRIKPDLFFLFLLTALAASSALAGESVRSAKTEARLVSEMEAIRPGTPFWAGIHMKMDPKWHTYWLNPGDSGIATRVEWDLPEGFSAGPLLWPFPARYDLPPLTVYAYEGETLLLTQITPPEDLPLEETIVLRASVDWLACEVNCIPGSAELSLPLTVQKNVVLDEVWSEAFSIYRAKLPLPEGGGWHSDAVVDEDYMLIRMEPPDWFEGKLGDLHFFSYADNLVDHAAPQHSYYDEGGYELVIKRSTLFSGPPESLAGIVVTSQGGWRGEGTERAVEIEMLPREGRVAPPQPAAPSMNVGLALIFALLGGMILNLMPCVFPVLSLKVMGFVEQAKGHQKGVWRHGLFFAGGVLTSFWVLAGLLIALRSAGHAVGWGFQLQSPLFIIGLSAVFFLFAMNLFGLFEVGTSLTGIGGAAGGRKGLSGSFTSGVLATVVATPCTAPFMGVALGFGLTQPVMVSMAIFTCLALGLALPYVLLASFPALLTRLPKPGPWMLYLKKVMGFALLATVLWLMWVLSLQTSPSVLVTLVGGLLLAGFGSWLYGLSQQSPRKRGKFLFLVPAAVLVIAGLLWPVQTLRLTGDIAAGGREASYSGRGIEWQSYSSELKEEALKKGKPVFLNFTAAWCLTCHVNEGVAFTSKAVQERFRELGVVAIKADWTSRSEEITRALASYGRSSIPFYVFYAEGTEAEPVILPEIITPRIVLEALEKVVV